jgi:hypothetical protein
MTDEDVPPSVPVEVWPCPPGNTAGGAGLTGLGCETGYSDGVGAGAGAGMGAGAGAGPGAGAGVLLQSPPPDPDDVATK